MIGKYERKDGLQRAKESNGLKNRLFSPVTKEELEKEIKKGDIKKIE